MILTAKGDYFSTPH